MISEPESPKTARATVYLEPELYRAAKVKAAASDRSFSDIVNDALRLGLSEDAADIATFERRAKQPARPFEDVLKSLRRKKLI